MPAASKCLICNKNVNKSDNGVRCKQCKNWYHAVCLKISDEVYAALGKKDSLLDFTCPSCRKNPPTHNYDSGSSELTRYIDELDKRISANFKKFTEELRSEQCDLKKLIESSALDIRSDLSSSLKELQDNIAVCNDTIKSVEIHTLDKINHLEMENNCLHRRINRADIVISGLPTGINNLHETVISIFAHYKINADIRDINHCFYIQKGRSVLMKLNNVQLRDELMKAYFKTRSLQLSDIIGTQLAARVYMNDHLTPACNKLQTICWNLRKDAKISWFRVLNGDMPSAKIKLPDGTLKQLNFQQCCDLRDGKEI